MKEIRVFKTRMLETRSETPCQIMFQIETLETLETPDAKKESKRWSVSECFVEMFPMKSLHGNNSFQAAFFFIDLIL